jgi:hypothetical protein
VGVVRTHLSPLFLVGVDDAVGILLLKLHRIKLRGAVCRGGGFSLAVVRATVRHCELAARPARCWAHQSQHGEKDGSMHVQPSP